MKSASALTTHTVILKNAGYLKVRKSFEGRMTRTDLCLTAKGQRAFEKHKEMLDGISKPPAPVEVVA